jgi:CBS domain-containing protein
LAGLLTDSCSEAFPTLADQWLRCSEPSRSFTAAGLSGICTRFPFHPSSTPGKESTKPAAKITLLSEKPPESADYFHQPPPESAGKGIPFRFEPPPAFALPPAKIFPIITLMSKFEFSRFYTSIFPFALAAIFLIAEITGGYGLMIPLMLVSSISFAISKRFEPYSFDIKHLADKGEVFTDDKDKNILQSIDFKRLIDTKFSPVKDSKTLDELIEKIKNSDDVLFPVLNDKNDLIGLIHLDDVRPIIFSAFKIKYTSIHEVVQPIKTVIQFNDTVDVIMDKFETSQQSILPVIQDKQFIGFLHKSDILEKYRDRLKEIIIE